MKNLKQLFFLLLVATFAVSCTTGDKFSGSPVGNLDIITLKGTITTPVITAPTGQDVALTGQEIEFTATLPDNKTFNDTVTVEVTTTAKSGGRTKGTVEIMPGQSSATGKVTVVGGSIFNTTFTLALSAISLQTVELGKQYLITSDLVTVKTGSSSIPDPDPDKLIVRLCWLFPSTTNNLKFNINRPGAFADANVLTLNSYGKVHFIRNVGTTNTGNDISSAEGDYVISIKAQDNAFIHETAIDMPYRLILIPSTGPAKVFEGVYPALTASSPLLPVLKINKLITNGLAVYTFTKL